MIGRRRGCLGLGCSVLVFGGIAAVLAVGVCGSRLAACPPADFPLPKGAHITNYDLKTSPRGGTCSVTWLVDEGPSEVSGFYSVKLDQGDWQTSPLALPGFEGSFSIQRRSHPAIRGSVRVVGAGSGARVRLVLQSDRYGFGR